MLIKKTNPQQLSLSSSHKNRRFAQQIRNRTISVSKSLIRKKLLTNNQSCIVLQRFEQESQRGIVDSSLLSHLNDRLRQCNIKDIQKEIKQSNLLGYMCKRMAQFYKVESSQTADYYHMMCQIYWTLTEDPLTLYQNHLVTQEVLTQVFSHLEIYDGNQQTFFHCLAASVNLLYYPETRTLLLPVLKQTNIEFILTSILLAQYQIGQCIPQTHKPQLIRFLKCYFLVQDSNKISPKLRSQVIRYTTQVLTKDIAQQIEKDVMSIDQLFGILFHTDLNTKEEQKLIKSNDFMTSLTETLTRMLTLLIFVKPVEINSLIVLQSLSASLPNLVLSWLPDHLLVQLLIVIFSHYSIETTIQITTLQTILNLMENESIQGKKKQVERIQELLVMAFGSISRIQECIKEQTITFTKKCQNANQLTDQQQTLRQRFFQFIVQMRNFSQHQMIWELPFEIDNDSDSQSL